MTQSESKPKSELKEKIWYIGNELSHLSTGDLARLRRGPLRDGEAGAPIFWQLSVSQKYGFPANEQWAAIIEAMALLTQRTPDGKGHKSPHNGKNRLGKALCDGGDANWGGVDARSALSELRLARLLNSRGRQRREGVVRAIRMLARSGTPVNCTDIAFFILLDKEDWTARAIAESFYRRLDGAGAKASKENA